MRRSLLALLALPVWAAPISVHDDAGRTVTLAVPAQRIISLSPHATELLFSLGAGKQLVGRDGASDYPAEVAKLPAVGLYGAFNVEAIVALRPDLVVAWEGPQAGQATARLRELGIPVFASQPGTIEAIPAALRALGNLAGRGRQADTEAQRFEAGWSALQAHYAKLPILRVVPQVGDEPAMTVNDQQFVAAVFRACGSRNPFGAERAAVPLLSPESLLAAKPEAIVALASDASAARWFARWRSLPLKPAYLAVEPDTLGRPALRVLPAAKALCSRLDTLRRPSAAKID